MVVMARMVFGVHRLSKAEAESAEAWARPEPIPVVGSLPLSVVTPGVPWVLVDGCWHKYRTFLSCRTDCGKDFGISAHTAITEGPPPEGTACDERGCQR